MSVKVTFDLGDADDLELISEVTRGRRALILLDEIRESIFRPARKHGYSSDSPLHKYINESTPEHDANLIRDVIAAGEEIFNSLLDEENLLRE